MSIDAKFKKLNDGNIIPITGLGTWKITDITILRETIDHAISVGYSHIDTASRYNNEHLIGEILNDTLKKIKRSELFITTKLWCSDFSDVEKALNSSLSKLKLDYVDLYLIHYPVELIDINGNITPVEPNFENLWSQMEEVRNKGLCKSIGVSNFGIKSLKKILSIAKIPPSVLQIEVHPYLKQTELLKFCEENNIFVVSYSSLKSINHDPTIIKDEKDKSYQNIKNKEVEHIRSKEKNYDDIILAEIASERKETLHSLILNFLRTKGIGVIPKSTNKKHIEENIKFSYLKPDDVKKIESIKKTIKVVDPIYLGGGRFD